MSKKAWILIGLVVLLFVGGAVLQKGMKGGNITLGFPESDFVVLTNGSYIFNDLELAGHTEASSYVIYTVEGEGTVSVDGLAYPLLNKKDLTDIKEGSLAGWQSGVYGMSTKITIMPESVIVVNGELDFKVSFLRR